MQQLPLFRDDERSCQLQGACGYKHWLVIADALCKARPQQVVMPHDIRRAVQSAGCQTITAKEHRVPGHVLQQLACDGIVARVIDRYGTRQFQSTYRGNGLRMVPMQPIWSAADIPDAICLPGELLTPREKDIAAGLANAMSNAQIAFVRGIAEHTAANHVCSIYQKTGCRTRAEFLKRLGEIGASG